MYNKHKNMENWFVSQNISNNESILIADNILLLGAINLSKKNEKVLI